MKGELRNAIRLGVVGSLLVAVVATTAYFQLRLPSPGQEGIVDPPEIAELLSQEPAEQGEVLEPPDSAYVSRSSIADAIPQTNPVTGTSGQGSAYPWSAEAAREELGRIERIYEQYLSACESSSRETPMIARSLVMRCVAVELEARGRVEVLQGTGLRALPERPEGERQFVVGNKLFVYTDEQYPALAFLRGKVIDLSKDPEAYTPWKPDDGLHAGIGTMVATAMSSLSAAVQ